MGILQRLGTLIRSNVNAAIDAASDPGKIVEQEIREMESAIADSRRELLSVLAAEKLAQKKVADARDDEKKWRARASGMSDPALAAEALREAERFAAIVATESAALAQDAYAIAELERSLKLVEDRLAQVKANKETCKIFAQNAKAAPGSAALADYDNTLGKIDTLEAEVALNDELTAKSQKDAATDAALARLDQNADLDARLQALKDKAKK